MRRKNIMRPNRRNLIIGFWAILLSPFLLSLILLIIRLFGIKIPWWGIILPMVLMLAYIAFIYFYAVVSAKLDLRRRKKKICRNCVHELNSVCLRNGSKIHKRNKECCDEFCGSVLRGYIFEEDEK